MRASTAWFCVMGACAALLAVQARHGFRARATARGRWDEQAALVKQLQLTDLCLFTDARYTRHLSQADDHAPFQDGPGALEHFPSGSFVRPPNVYRDLP